LRTLDRRARRGLLSEDDLVERRGLAVRLLDRFERIEMTATVLRRACEPFPTPLGTLDAIHLATVVSWSASFGERLVLATHDAELARAAEAMGFTVLGA
jgi:predicted nucleic acid-binding protein